MLNMNRPPSASSPVCRTCLGIISEDKKGYNIDDEYSLVRNVQNIREMLMFCIPEVDVYVSVNPAICDACLALLVNIYNFKVRCMRVENVIRTYISTNNVMEGSCVNLSNVVRQQIIEALRHKNWTPDVIGQYMTKVDNCLKNSQNHILPPQAFNANTTVRNPFAASNTELQFLSNIPSIQPTPNSNPLLNSLLNTASSSVPPPPSYDQVLRETSREICPPPQSTPRRYLSVSKNLMPAEKQQAPLPFSQELQNINRLSTNPIFNSLQLTPNLARLATPSTTVGYQNVYLSHLTTAPSQSTRTSRPRNKRPVPSKDDGINLCPITGVVSKTNSQPIVLNSYLGPQYKRKNDDKLDKILKAPRKEGGEVLVMNFCEPDEDVLLVEDATTTSTSTSQESSVSKGISKDVSKITNELDLCKKIVVKVPTIDKEILKRKLTPEDVIEEILSKRRRCTVKLNTNLPYLHKNKKLVVRLRKYQFITCELCSFTTTKSEVLKNHYMNMHRVCRLCNFHFKTKQKLDDHILQHHLAELNNAIKDLDNKPQFECLICNFVGVSAFDVRDHRIRMHIKAEFNGSLVCPICNMKYSSSYSICRHMERTHDKDLRKQCPMCNLTLGSLKNLKGHLQNHLAIQNTFMCTFCGKNHRTSAALKGHMKKKHTNASAANLQGVVYALSLGHQGDLTTDEHGRITLTRTSQQTTIPNQSRQAATDAVPFSFDLPGFSEMLCSQALNEIPEQEDDCTIVSETAQGTHSLRRIRKSTVMNRKNKKMDEKEAEAAAVDDPDDCLIITEEPEVVTLDSSDDEGVSESQPSKKQGPNHCDVVSDAPATDTCSEMNEGLPAMISIKDIGTISHQDSSDPIDKDPLATEESGCENQRAASQNKEKVEENATVSVTETEKDPKSTSSVVDSVASNTNNKHTDQVQSETGQNEELMTRGNLLDELEDLLDSAVRFPDVSRTSCATAPESVVIESSDEDSNDCIIQSVTEKNDVTENKGDDAEISGLPGTSDDKNTDGELILESDECVTESQPALENNIVTENAEVGVGESVLPDTSEKNIQTINKEVDKSGDNNASIQENIDAVIGEGEVSPPHTKDKAVNSSADNEIQTNVADIEDSSENVIISDSEPGNSLVSEKLLNVELTPKARDDLLNVITDNILSSESEIESEKTRGIQANTTHKIDEMVLENMESSGLDERKSSEDFKKSSDPKSDSPVAAEELPTENPPENLEQVVLGNIEASQTDIADKQSEVVPENIQSLEADGHELSKTDHSNTDKTESEMENDLECNPLTAKELTIDNPMENLEQIISSNIEASQPDVLESRNVAEKQSEVVPENIQSLGAHGCELSKIDYSDTDKTQSEMENDLESNPLTAEGLAIENPPEDLDQIVSGNIEASQPNVLESKNVEEKHSEVVPESIQSLGADGCKLSKINHSDTDKTQSEMENDLESNPLTAEELAIANPPEDLEQIVSGDIEASQPNVLEFKNLEEKQSEVVPENIQSLGADGCELSKIDHSDTDKTQSEMENDLESNPLTAEELAIENPPEDLEQIVSGNIEASQHNVLESKNVEEKQSEVVPENIQSLGADGCELSQTDHSNADATESEMGNYLESDKSAATSLDNNEAVVSEKAESLAESEKESTLVSGRVEFENSEEPELAVPQDGAKDLQSSEASKVPFENECVTSIVEKENQEAL